MSVPTCWAAADLRNFALPFTRFSGDNSGGRVARGVYLCDCHGLLRYPPPGALQQHAGQRHLLQHRSFRLRGGRGLAGEELNQDQYQAPGLEGCGRG